VFVEAVTPTRRATDAKSTFAVFSYDTSGPQQWRAQCHGRTVPVVDALRALHRQCVREEDAGVHVVPRDADMLAVATSDGLQLVALRRAGGRLTSPRCRPPAMSV
jgi:hypothetical protein